MSSSNLIESEYKEHASGTAEFNKYFWVRSIKQIPVEDWKKEEWIDQCISEKDREEIAISRYCIRNVFSGNPVHLLRDFHSFKSQIHIHKPQEIKIDTLVIHLQPSIYKQLTRAFLSLGDNKSLSESNLTLAPSGVSFNLTDVIVSPLSVGIVDRIFFQTFAQVIFTCEPRRKWYDDIQKYYTERKDRKSKTQQLQNDFDRLLVVVSMEE